MDTRIARVSSMACSINSKACSKSPLDNSDLQRTYFSDFSDDSYVGSAATVTSAVEELFGSVTATVREELVAVAVAVAATLALSSDVDSELCCTSLLEGEVLASGAAILKRFCLLNK